jgi:hypothetical protein
MNSEQPLKNLCVIVGLYRCASFWFSVLRLVDGASE